jgi:uncharacterized protein (TIGR02246 family)
MPFEGPVEDRLAIRELVTNYGDAVTNRDADQWIATWAEDAVWLLPEIPGMERIEGRDNILAAWMEGMKQFPFQVNIQTVCATYVTGETAHGHTYTSELVKDLDDNRARWTGRYDDEYVKQNGNWVFKSRSFRIVDIGAA